MCLAERLDFLMLQETLGDGPSVLQTLKPFFLDWEFFFLDARGRLRGIALGFNKTSVKITNVWGG